MVRPVSEHEKLKKIHVDFICSTSTCSLLTEISCQTRQVALAALPRLFFQLGQYGRFDVYTPSRENTENPGIGGPHAGDR